MYKLCVFAGTTEGRELVELLADQPAAVTACVATEYGESLLTPREDRCCVVRDIPVPDGGEEELRTRLVDRVNREEEPVRFFYVFEVDRRGLGSARVVLVGPTAAVLGILQDT